MRLHDYADNRQTPIPDWRKGLGPILAVLIGLGLWIMIAASVWAMWSLWSG